MTTVSFKTVGCRLNQAETAEMEAAFRKAGCRVSVFSRPCEVYIVHGCAVTAAAERDSLRLARSARRRNPRALIVVAGCAAERMLRDAGQDNGPVDLWIAQNKKPRLPQIVLQTIGQQPLPEPAHDPDTVAGWRDGNRTRALLKVQDGCPFRCAYCIVPHLRSHVVSRPVTAISAAARQLAHEGCREIVLTGANLGCYRAGSDRLPQLLRELDNLPGGVERIRLSSIEPVTVEKPVIDIMADSQRICRYLHLPLQSGDDNMLRAMQRRYTVDEYRRIIDYAVHRLSCFGLGTDIIVGFPGETDGFFTNTLRLVEELPFSNLHVFPFSPRPGTAAAELPDTVPQSVKRERVRVLNRLGSEKQARFAAQQSGRTVRVLVEKLRDGTGSGWTEEYLPAQVCKTGLTINSIVQAKVCAAENGTLILDHP